MTERIDSALKENLEELIQIAKDVGALDCLILRQPSLSRLFYDAGSGQAAIDLIPRDEKGMLVIFRFAASDGGEARVEVK